MNSWIFGVVHLVSPVGYVVRSVRTTLPAGTTAGDLRRAGYLELPQLGRSKGSVLYRDLRILDDKLRPIFSDEFLNSHQWLADDCSADAIGSRQEPLLLIERDGLDVLSKKGIALKAEH